MGQRWCIRQVIDAADSKDKAAKVIYKVVVGDGAYRTGVTARDDFRLWARFEVVPADGLWLRVDVVTPAEETAEQSG